jgi:hypothetical protein
MNAVKYKESDETLDRLVAMINQTCLVAIDKTLGVISRSANAGYAAAAARASSIGERINRANKEVGATLPK